MSSAATAINRLIARDGMLAHTRELVLIVGAYFVYMIIRNVIAPNFDNVAFDNAVRLISFESARGFFWEITWHGWAIDAGKWVVVLFNWIYIVTFFPIVLATALIYYIFDRDKYFYYRSIILLSFAVALVVFSLYPLAPPRMMPGSGFVDTFKVFGPSWYASREMASYYNAFAAMPSLHFAWTVIFGVLFFRQGGLHFKLLGILYPTMTLFAITITANHYIMDALVGAAMMLLTYLVYEFLIHRRLFLKIRFLGIRPNFHLPIPSLKKGGSNRFGAPHSGTSA